MVDSWLISLVLGRKIVVGLDTPTSSLCGRLELSRRLRFSSPGSAPSRPPARPCFSPCVPYVPTATVMKVAGDQLFLLSLSHSMES